MITDEELTALALAGDPDTEVPAGALPISEVVDTAGPQPLVSSWYMPAPAVGLHRLTGWRRNLVIFLVVVFLAIEAAGLCSAYGSVVIG